MIESDRYSFSNLLRAISNPRLFIQELEHGLRMLHFRIKYGSGIDVMDRDWDNLILLDACRYDAFQAQNTIQGKLERVVSKGAHSEEFIKKNFAGRELHDTVYVSANPHTEYLTDDVFYAVDPVYQQWDENVGTVLPSTVVERAVESHQQHPDKRLIIHFMQPHAPYLGPMGEKLREEFGVRGWENFRAHDNASADQRGISVWEAVRDGHITQSKLWTAYAETLIIALEHASEVVDAIGGKTAISADHGELLGEQPYLSRTERYGHPHMYSPELRVVPWLVIGARDRRSVTSEEPLGFDRLAEGAVNDRLRALGYKT